MICKIDVIITITLESKEKKALIQTFKMTIMEKWKKDKKKPKSDDK